MMKKEHLSTDKPARNREEKLDKQLSDSFPTSDPPSYSPGAVGAPKNRKSGAKNAKSRAVTEAERKVKSGAARVTDKY